MHCRLIGMAFMVSAGCSGHGTIQLVSLNLAEIEPPPSKVWNFDAQESYWWTDSAGELNISLRHQQRSLILGKFGSVDLGLSFVFDAPPAGRTRNYSIGQREVRAIYATPLASQRFLPVAGIVAVIIGEDGIMRGSYRLWTAPLVETSLFSILPQRPGNMLCFGTFQAVQNEVRGKEIRSFCEANGFARLPKGKATSMPATSRPEKRAP